ncbi:MAG: hypothetical protein R3C53_25670 [Pirellulaceae bacterium]
MPDRHDDGGFTGGNMDRPAAQVIAGDIEAGKVELCGRSQGRPTKPLATDFARMLEVFERNQVAFVSVTQQFNTTNSIKE